MKIEDPQFIDVTPGESEHFDWEPFIDLDGVSLPIGDGWTAGRIPARYFEPEQTYRFVRGSTQGLSEANLIAIRDDLDDATSLQALAAAVGEAFLKMSWPKLRTIPAVAVWAPEGAEVDAEGWPVVRTPAAVWNGSWFAHRDSREVERWEEVAFAQWRETYSRKLQRKTGERFIQREVKQSDQ